jgi:hypothetical protein
VAVSEHSLARGQEVRLVSWTALREKLVHMTPT